MPVSSNRIMITFGVPGGGSWDSGHHGSDSATVRPITPPKCSALCVPMQVHLRSRGRSHGTDGFDLAGRSENGL